MVCNLLSAGCHGCLWREVCIVVEMMVQIDDGSRFVLARLNELVAPLLHYGFIREDGAGDSFLCSWWLWSSEMASFVALYAVVHGSGEVHGVRRCCGCR